MGADLGLLHLHRTLNDMPIYTRHFFFSRFLICASSSRFVPIQAESRRFSVDLGRVTLITAKIGLETGQNTCSKKDQFLSTYYLKSEVHMGACQKANVSNIKLSQKKDQF